MCVYNIYIIFLEEKSEADVTPVLKVLSSDRGGYINIYNKYVDSLTHTIRTRPYAETRTRASFSIT